MTHFPRLDQDAGPPPGNSTGAFHDYLKHSRVFYAPYAIEMRVKLSCTIQDLLPSRPCAASMGVELTKAGVPWGQGDGR